MSRTGLYDCHNFEILCDDIMRDSKLGMGVLHVKVKYWRIFGDVISLLAQVFIVSFDRTYKEVSTKKYLTFSVAQFLWYDCTFKNLCTIPATLAFEGQLFLWIDYQSISVMYKCQSDISTNSRVIKYQNVEKIPISHHWAIGFHGNKNKLLHQFNNKKFARVLGTRIHRLSKESITIGPVLWPVHCAKTDKQTYRQTNLQTAVTNIPVLCEKSKTFAK